MSYTCLIFSIVAALYALSVNISLSFANNHKSEGIEFFGPVGHQSFIESKPPGLAVNLMF